MPENHRGSPPEPKTEETQSHAGRRARLAIPVKVKIGQQPARDCRLHDVSVSGYRIDWVHQAAPGDQAIARFAGYPDVCPAFILHGRVARVIDGRSPGLGVSIDRQGSSPEALRHLTRLVLHYMRHKPLLEDLARDFFEGRCGSCDWIGRVGVRTPVCPRCGERVKPLDTGQ